MGDRETIESVLERVRQRLRADGADVELIGVDNGVVTLQLIGSCLGCPMTKIALMVGLENALREAVAGVRKVVLVRNGKKIA